MLSRSYIRASMAEEADRVTRSGVNVFLENGRSPHVVGGKWTHAYRLKRVGGADRVKGRRVPFARLCVYARIIHSSSEPR